MSGIQNIQSTIPQASQNAGATPIASGTKGHWQGLSARPVAVREDMSLSSAEEISYAAGERGGNEASKRKKSDEVRDRLLKAGSLEQGQQVIPGLPFYEAETFVRAVRQNGSGGQGLLQLAEKFFRDPTAQHAAISFARQQCSEDSELGKALDEALALLEAKSGPAVRAGYNISEVESEVFSPQEARDCYRHHVLNYSSYEKSFVALMQEFGPGEFPKAVNFLRKALGADMSAVTPSTEKVVLHEVAEGLYITQNLGNMYASADKLLKESAARFGLVEPHARQVLEPLLRLKEAAVNESQLKREIPSLNSKNPSRDAVFIRGVRELARALPLKLYPSAHERQFLLDALQGVLDKAIEREEELEEHA